MIPEPYIRVLGPTVLGVGSMARSLHGLPERALWLLIASMERKVSTNELADALWPEELPSTWRSALRTHLTTLRRALMESQVPMLLSHNRSGYWLAGELDYVDLHQFRSLTHASRTSGSSEAELALLSRARQLWTHAPFLTSDHLLLRALSDRLVGAFDELERQRHLLHVECGQAKLVIEELLPALQDATDLAVVEPLLAAYLETDDEESATSLLLRHRRAVEVLGLEIGSSVSALERRLLLRRVRTTQVPIPALLQGRTNFVGRAALLDQFWRDAEESPYFFTLLQGPPGHGKSHLVAQIARDAASRSWPVVAAAAEEHGPPLQLIRDLLQPWIEFTDGGMGIESFENVIGSIVDASPTGRAVVILEDFHFADLASTKLLRRLFRREATSGLALILTSRDGLRSSAVESALAEFSQLEGSRIVPVLPFTLEETFALVQRQTSYSASASWTLSTRLLRRSGGVPITLQFLLDNLENEQEGSEVEASASSAILSSVERLDSETLRVLTIGALLSETPNASVLADVCAVSLASVFDSFDSAFVLGLTQRRIGSALGFRHQLVRQVLVGRQSITWRCEVHRRLANRLRAGKGDVFAVAQQAAKALVGDTASDYLEEVLDGIRSLQAANRWEESLAVLDCIDSFLSDPPHWFQADTVFELLILRALACDGSADANVARHYFRRAVELSKEQSRGDWLLRTALASAGSSQPLDGDLERVGWLRNALTTDATLDPRLRIEALSEYVYVQGIASVDADVCAARDELLSLAASINNDHAIAYAAHGTLITTLASPGVHDRIALCEKAIRSGGAVPPEIAATPLLVLMHSHFQLGDYAKAAEQLLAVEALANRRQRPGDRWVLLLLRAMMEEWSGNLDASDSYGGLALSLANRHDIRGGNEAWFVTRVSRAFNHDDLKTLDEFAQVAQETTFGQALRAYVLARGSQTRSAAELARGVVRSLHDDPVHLSWVASAMFAGAACAHLGGSLAEDCVELLTPFSGLLAINGVVPISTLGPVDRILSGLCRALQDFTKSSHYSARAEELLISAQLVGWARP